MKLTDEQLERLLELRGERLRQAEKASAEAGIRRTTRSQRQAPDSGVFTPVWRPLFDRWTPVLFAVAASVVLSLVSVNLILKKSPEWGTRTAWVTRSGNAGQSLSTLVQGGLGRAGWRRAGLTMGVSDYGGFRQPRLADLPLATSEAAKARRALEIQMRAARPHIMSLLNASATETAARAAVRWLQRFDQPGDLIFIYVASHGYAGPDGRLHLILSDSQHPGEHASASVTGLPAEDLLKPLAALASTTVLLVDVCHSGALKDLALGPRQCVVGSAGASELAIDSVFGEAWFGGLQGSADANGDGVITLREAFDASCRLTDTIQHPVLQEGRPGLADEVILNVQQQMATRLSPPGASMSAPGLIEFVPDGPCQVWMDSDLVGIAHRPVLLATGGSPVLLRAVRLGWSGAGAEWRDSAPGAPAPAEVLQRAAVFGTAAHQPPETSVRLTGIGSAASAFPRLEVFGQPLVLGTFTTEGVLTVERPSGSGVSGLVLLANDAVSGVDIAALTQARPGDTVRLSISAKAEEGAVKVTFFAGGRLNESLNPRVEKTVQLDQQWQNVELALPAERTDRLVSGFGLAFSSGDEGQNKIFVRNITLGK